MSNIEIRGARQNNLKNIDLSIPRNKIVLFTGVSGSGKSSLVFETITAEAQRQLYDTFSTFARNRLPKYEPAECDAISNLSPVIVLEQKRMTGNAKSTVGTSSEISSFLRLLFSRVGQPQLGTSNYFSFNAPEGMCPKCGGVGAEVNLDLDKVFDWDLSLNQGGIRFPDFKLESLAWKVVVNTGLFDNDKPLKNFSDEEKDLLLYADGVATKYGDESSAFDMNFNGVVTKIKKGYLSQELSSLTERRQKIIKQFTSQKECGLCHGSRLHPRALEVKINGHNIHQLSNFQLNDLHDFVSGIGAEEAATLVEQIQKRCRNLMDLGVGYLNLSRPVATLSGGEAQRLKLSKQLGNSLTEMIYVLDEPSVGLHPRDVHLVNELLLSLRDAGNTILVVEHDPDIIKIADHIVDIGPRAGIYGGELVFQGSYADILKSEGLTAQMLRQGAYRKGKYREAKGHFEIRNARVNNLKNLNVDIPKAVLSCITGVAGSGKSSLVHKAFHGKYPDAIVIDQSPVGKSSRSNPATYTGVFDDIRKLFAAESGANAAMFSFNSKGACEKCKGLGHIYVDMAFLEPVKKVCDACDGKRFSSEARSHHYAGHSIDQVLDLSINQAMKFFRDAKVLRKIEVLQQVGLGYLKLGQSLDTLSGGECQRIKLASELHKKGKVYILDEPSTGLHLSDIRVLIDLLNDLVDKGNTLIVIEHNLDIINASDWIIDIGPEGGDLGGQLLFTGTADELAEETHSHTGRYLKAYRDRLVD